jgi:superfamily II DNA or RNA helicase
MSSPNPIWLAPEYRPKPRLDFLERQYQIDCLTNILAMTDDRGRIIMPTASGKTYMATLTIKFRLGGTHSRVHLVVAPRIALVAQHQREYREELGKKYIAFAFHSGETERDWTKVDWEEGSSTKPEDIAVEIERAHELNKDLIIFTTYHSFGRLIDYEFATVVFDESQYCVTENGFDHIKDMNADLMLFFTATEKRTNSPKGRGLNNVDVFGEIIYQVAPQPLITLGYILPPCLHIMTATAADDTTLIDEICTLANEQIRLSSGVPERKVLFACKGTADVKEVVDNMAAVKARIPGYRIYTILSNNDYAAMIDGNKVSRMVFMDELSKDKFAIVLHYDILSEGIDIDGFTGVAILRNMPHAKILQTIGRAQRVYKPDRVREIFQRVKKFAFVSCKVINGNQESEEYLRNIVRMIRESGYEVNSEYVDFTDEEGAGISDDDDLDSLLKLDRKAKTKKLLERIIHEVETEEEIYVIRQMTPLELIGAMK